MSSTIRKDIRDRSTIACQAILVAIWYFSANKCIFVSLKQQPAVYVATTIVSQYDIVIYVASKTFQRSLVCVRDFPTNNPLLYQRIPVLSSTFRSFFANFRYRFEAFDRPRLSRALRIIRPLSSSIPLIASNHASIIPEFLSFVKPLRLLYSSISLWGLIEGLYRIAHSRCASILSQSRAPVKPHFTTMVAIFRLTFERFRCIILPC